MKPSHLSCTCPKSTLSAVLKREAPGLVGVHYKVGVCQFQGARGWVGKKGKTGHVKMTVFANGMKFTDLNLHTLKHDRHPFYMSLHYSFSSVSKWAIVIQQVCTNC